MFRIYPFRFTNRTLSRDQIVPPNIIFCVPCRVTSGALIHNYAMHHLATAHCQSFIHSGFQRHHFAAANLCIGSNHRTSLRIGNALIQAFGRKTTEHYRVNCTNSRTRLHGNHGLNTHWHIDNDTITFFDTARFQAVGELTHSCVQIAVIDFRDRAVIRLENQRGFFRLSR